MKFTIANDFPNVNVRGKRVAVVREFNGLCVIRLLSGKGTPYGLGYVIPARYVIPSPAGTK